MTPLTAHFARELDDAPPGTPSEHVRPYAVDEAIPPGYRLTDAARERLFLIAQAANRHERRGLLRFFRQHPIETFELATVTQLAPGDVLYATPEDAARFAP